MSLADAEAHIAAQEAQLIAQIANGGHRRADERAAGTANLTRRLRPANGQPRWSTMVRAYSVFVLYEPHEMIAKPLSASAAAISVATWLP